ncbi:MAG: hypothetical protein R2911_32265 [Caldilineaceae bacterium]
MTRYIVQLIALLVLVTTAWSSVQAADVNSLALAWFTADGGGQVAASSGGENGRFQLNGTFGQTDANSQVQGARFGLNTGFWGELEESPAGQSNDKVYLPVIRVNN